MEKKLIRKKGTSNTKLEVFGDIRTLQVIHKCKGTKITKINNHLN
jgi:hypothetical protein